jgi:hypothetical protein
MSFHLADSGGIQCKTNPDFEKDAKGLLDNSINVGDYYIEVGDFCGLVEYFLTNVDLADDDPRKVLVDHIKAYQLVPGWRKGNVRFGSPAELEHLEKQKIDEVIRRWLPGQSYGYNEAVGEIMQIIGERS